MIKILSSLVVIMGIIHIGATFSPLIGGKLESLDPRTYNAVIYMSLMCGGFLIMLGAYLVWAIDKIGSEQKIVGSIRSWKVDKNEKGSLCIMELSLNHKHKTQYEYYLQPDNWSSPRVHFC